MLARDLLDHLRRDAAADIARDERLAGPEVEEVRRIDARVDAGEHEQAQLGEDRRTPVTARVCVGAVAFE
jgi:hypothetical protein